MSRRLSFILGLALVLLLMAACGGDDINGDADTGSEVVGDAQNGQALYMMTTIEDTGAPGCITCHSVEPTDDPLQPAPVGPSHYGLADRAGGYVEGMSAEAYLRESIVEPDAHIVEGFQPGLMYQNYEENLTEEHINDLVAYLLTLEGE
ncbi:MAG TPA: cytochrome c [Candidatus Sulfomarinibacteraceae bacterium]|nr:cytochrome c [Candidatus Sulfomarinibacteraceae bacterium]